MNDSPRAVTGARASGCGTRAAILAWSVAAALAIFVAVWPLLGGMVVVNDDIKFVRGSTSVGSIGERIARDWSTKGAFRPLESIVGALSDETTLACGAAIAAQVAGLLLLLAGAAALARRVMPGVALAPPLLVLWLLISPSTTASLWQLDTCSQTWSAALAVWAGLVAWNAVNAARAGRVAWGALVLLAAIFIAGCTIKEIFYGWSFGIGIALGCVLVSMWRTDRAAALRLAWLVVPVVIVPLAHLGVRMASSAIGQSTPNADYGDRYHAVFGANILVNAAFSAGGLTTVGPLHAMMDGRTAMLIRGLPIAAVLAFVCAVGAALSLMAMHRRAADGIRAVDGIQWRVIVLACVAGLASMVITLPMESVSDLYGLGPNVASGLLLVAAAVALWNPVQADERMLSRGVAVVTAAVIAAAGAYGLYSRAYHFHITWQYAQIANRTLLDAQATLSADASRDPVIIRIVENCFTADQYGQIVIAPARSVFMEDTIPWMNRRDPSRKVSWQPDTSVTGNRDGTLVMNCADFPVREHK